MDYLRSTVPALTLQVAKNTEEPSRYTEGGGGGGGGEGGDDGVVLEGLLTMVVVLLPLAMQMAVSSVQVSIDHLRLHAFY